MYSSSPKAGIAQKKKKQAIRRLSQTSNRRGSSLTHGRSASFAAVAARGRGKGARDGRIHSSSTRGGHLHNDSSKSLDDNPFLKGLTSTRQEESSTQPQTLHNPFLSGLSRPQQPRPPPPSYDSIITENDPQTSLQSQAPSFPPSITHAPDPISTSEQQFYPFLAQTEHRDSHSESIPVLTTQREEEEPSHSKVSLGPSLAGTVSQPGQATRRVPSYSEVTSIHTRPVVGRQGRGDGAHPPPQHANLKTLHVKGIADELNTSAVLREHFSTFGDVTLLKCVPSKKFATVEFETRDGAIKAKKLGKLISPAHEPVQIFWNTSKLKGPRPGSELILKPETGGKSLVPSDPRVNRRPVPAHASTESVQEKKKPPPKSSIWSRLGPEKGTDKSWTPAEGIVTEEEEDVADGVYEGKDFLKDLGNKLTGDEMDTIARTANHSYFLRSLMQPEASDGPSAPPPSFAPLSDRGQLPDSRQLYDIPRSDIPLLPHSQGSTAAECYEALDARDQKIRKGTVKQTVLSEAKAIVGTCPDMCPEKERYRREDTRRLSWFEVSRVSTTGKPKVDHTKAIKEYSGSAADKEEPLPHDLRPLSVLQMTMDYLVASVIDDYRERPADWYDFVWNRTRGIRKDITLQHLCSVDTAQLIEKCARFHILCSHLLCEEGTMTFDPKMNNENLNKCLLSLKEFYRDLRVEKGILCSNEAEFCCYDILLHLTDGNVLNLVTQYSDSVRDSPEVRFAVDVALSVDSNNFVKFFKLVRAATYLSACILHRYFNQVRSKALRVLNRSHTTPKKPTNFPLSDLSRLLSFESNEKAAEFCELTFNLTVLMPERAVQLVRGTVCSGEQTVPVQRSLHLVEAKNQKRLGEVVNGGPLPCLFSHTPFSSFTSESQPPPQVVEPAPPYIPPPQPEPAYTEQDLAMVVQNVTCEAVSVGVEEVTRECMLEEKQLVDEVDALVSEVVKSETQESAQKVILEALEVKAVKDKIADSLVGETFRAVLSVEISEAVQTVYWDAVMNAQATDAAAAHLTEELVEESVCEGVSEGVSETLSQLKRDRKEKLETIRQRCVLQRTCKYWQRWCQALKVRKHVRQCASDIPPLPSLMSLPWQLDVLCPLEKRRRVEVTTSVETAGQLEESRKERERRRQEFYAPLELPSILKDSLLAYHTLSHASHPHTPHIHWKLTFLYPPHHTLCHTDAHTLQWLYRKLRLGTDWSMQDVPCQSSEQLAVYSTPVQVGGASLWESQTTKRLINVVVQGVCSNWGESVSGSSGILLYVPLPQRESVQDYVSRVFAMLRVVMRSHRSSTGLPLLLAHSGEMESSRHFAAWITLRRALEDYCKQSNACLSTISCLKLEIPGYVPPSQIIAENLVCSCLQWLVEHSPPPPPLMHTPVKDFVEEGLLDLFVPLVVSDNSARDKAGLSSHPPAPLISLYNYVLEHLVAIATSDEMLALDWPIPECAPKKFSYRSLPPVCWNSLSYLTELQQCIVSLQFPPPPAMPQDWAEADWSYQSVQCLDYVASIEVPGSQHNSVTLLSRIKSLLHHHCHVFESGETTQLECSVPWAKVILACIEHILSCLDSDLWASSLQSHKLAFTVPTSWLRAQAETSLAMAEKVTDGQTPKQRRRRRHRSDPHLTTMSLSLSAHSPTTSSAPKPVGLVGSSSVGVSPSGRPVGEGKDDVKEKLQLLQREKERSQRFEAQLQEWLGSTSVLDTETAEAASSVSPALVLDDVDRPSSLTEKLKELQLGIRAAKWREKEANSYLQQLLDI